MKSAIGTGLTREDHPSVSNQLYAYYAQGKDTLDMKAVVGEDALSLDDKNFLIFLEKFESDFLRQGKYEGRDIFTSLDKAWELLRTFEKISLNKIDKKVLDKYYDRRGQHGAQPKMGSAYENEEQKEAREADYEEKHGRASKGKDYNDKWGSSSAGNATTKTTLSDWIVFGGF